MSFIGARTSAAVGSFDATPGTQIDVSRAFDESDDFLSGGNDHFGEVSDSYVVPHRESVSKQIKKRLVESILNGGDIPVTYTITFAPKE